MGDYAIKYETEKYKNQNNIPLMRPSDFAIVIDGKEMKLYSWKEWNMPEYHERLKPS